MVADYKELTQSVVNAISRAYGELPPPLWPDLAPVQKPEVRAVFGDNLTASIELAWGGHKEQFGLTPQEVAMLHDGLSDLLRRAYEKAIAPAPVPAG